MQRCLGGKQRGGTLYSQALLEKFGILAGYSGGVFSLNAKALARARTRARAWAWTWTWARARARASHGHAYRLYLIRILLLTMGFFGFVNKQHRPSDVNLTEILPSTPRDSLWSWPAPQRVTTGLVYRRSDAGVANPGLCCDSSPCMSPFTFERAPPRPYPLRSNCVSCIGAETLLYKYPRTSCAPPEAVKSIRVERAPHSSVPYLCRPVGFLP